MAIPAAGAAAGGVAGAGQVEAKTNAAAAPKGNPLFAYTPEAMTEQAALRQLCLLFAEPYQEVPLLLTTMGSLKINGFQKGSPYGDDGRISVRKPEDSGYVLNEAPETHVLTDGVPITKEVLLAHIKARLPAGAGAK